MLNPTVAALFVETRGVYFGVDGVDPWDVTRGVVQNLSRKVVLIGWVAAFVLGLQLGPRLRDWANDRKSETR